MISVLAIDPGDERIGVAQYYHGDISCMTVHADEIVRDVQELFGQGGNWRLIIEEFHLYPHKQDAMNWNPMKTSQMIGALKVIADQHNVPVVEQGAMIKQPTRGHLRARGIQQVGAGTHARDAELHLYHYLFKEGLLWK